jgi:hypothetical protein
MRGNKQNFFLNVMSYNEKTSQQSGLYSKTPTEKKKEARSGRLSSKCEALSSNPSTAKKKKPKKKKNKQQQQPTKPG